MVGRGMNSVLAIVIASCGTEGTPRKETWPFFGKPLLAHTIDLARATPSVTRVVVVTDNVEIAAAARLYMAEVVTLPAHPSGDSAVPESVLLHVLDYLQAGEGYEPELVVSLQATSPVRRPADIQTAVETLQHEQADSLFSAYPARGSVWRSHGDELVPISHDDRRRPQYQNRGEDLIENGSIYVFKPWVVRQLNNRLGGKIAIHRMTVMDSLQVDEPGDLELIEHWVALKQPAASQHDLQTIRLLVLDFDGVMTDNRVLVHQDGTEAVWCHRGDGWGIGRLKEKGVLIFVISTETNPVVEARCRKLNLDFVQGCNDKLGALKRIVAEHQFAPDQVAYVGNDVNDLECMRWVGTPIAVADAMPEIRDIARLVTVQRGGYGAVREVTDWLFQECQRRDNAK
jgi:YrbI family 3-deoxy-D-manno-octulosonate 8-phosphate phosphatase